MKVDIKEILKSVVKGSSERAGCSDGERARLNEMVKLAESENPQDHKTLYGLVYDAASYN